MFHSHRDPRRVQNAWAGAGENVAMSPAWGTGRQGAGSGGGRHAAEHPKVRCELFSLYSAGSAGVDTFRYVFSDQEMSQVINL